MWCTVSQEILLFGLGCLKMKIIIIIIAATNPKFDKVIVMSKKMTKDCQNIVNGAALKPQKYI